MHNIITHKIKKIKNIKKKQQKGMSVLMEIARVFGYLKTQRYN